MSLKNRRLKGIRYGLLIPLVFSFFLYPFFFRLNLVGSNLRFDILILVKPYAWIFLITQCGLLACDVLLERKFGLLHLLISMLLSYGLFVASQYPNVLYYDFWVHSGGARQILLHGTSNVENSYANSWPGAFSLIAAASEITSLSVTAVNTLLSFLVLGVSAMLLYLLGRRIVSEQWAGLPGLLYFVSNAYVFQFLDRDRFSPFTLASTISLIFLYSVVLIDHRTSSLAHHTTMLVAMISIVVSHVFVSMFVVLILLGLTITQRLGPYRSRSPTTWVFLASTLWLVWWNSQSPSTFEKAIIIASGVFEKFNSLKIVGVVRATESSNDLGAFLSSLYFRGMIIGVSLIALVSILKYHRDRKSWFRVGSFLGALFFGLLTLLAPVSETNVQWSRILSLSLLSITFAASFFLSRKNLRAVLISFVLVLLIVPSFLVSLSYLSLSAEATHVWETNGLQFLANHVSKSVFLESDKVTARLYKSYFDEHSIAQVREVPLKTADYRRILERDPCFFRGDTVIRSLRQEWVENIFATSQEEMQQVWLNVDYCLDSDLSRNKVYDNEFFRIHKSHRAINDSL